MRTTTRRTTAVLGLALLLTGCSDGAPTADTSSAPATVEAATTTAPTPAVLPAPAQEPELEFLSGPLPSDVELDRSVGDALDAYLAHRVLYDAAAQAGFADEEMVAELLATTSGDLQAAIEQGVEHFTSEGLAVDGSSEVLDIRASWLHFSAADVAAPDITFEVCLRLTGGTEPADRGSTDELVLTVRMADQAGSWVVWSQRDYGDDCEGGSQP